MSRSELESRTAHASVESQAQLESEEAKTLLKGARFNLFFFLVGSWLIPFIPVAGILWWFLLATGLLIWLPETEEGAEFVGIPVYGALLLLSYLAGRLRAIADPLRWWTAIPAAIIYPLVPAIGATMNLRAMSGQTVEFERLIVPVVLMLVVAGLGGKQGAKRFWAELRSKLSEAEHL